MNLSNKLLSDVTAFRTYSKYMQHLGRREVLEETINRDMNMHLNRFPKLSAEITRAFSMVHDLKVMPSMRSMQFAGDAISKNNARIFNCSFLNADSPRAFGEELFLLLSGVGVGYSVQRRHTEQLPVVRPPGEEGKFIVHDSIQGWAQSVDTLMEAYFFGRIRPVFDFSQVRPKGSYLVTTGAKAPGPEPLRAMLIQVEKKLKTAIGRKLKPIEIHDIMCMISDCVLAGGIRRAALISLFDRDDREMMTCKSGSWWETAPWRARSNNSAVLPRGEVTKEEFMEIFKACQDSGAGEPGFSWTNDADNMGYNPCHEIALMSKQFCNLTTINVTGAKTEKEFLKRVHAATLIGTLQASYTDFPYLTPDWKINSEMESLLGVSMTGVADAGDFLTPELLEKGAKLALEVNEKIARKIGINPAARVTAIKPEGTSSCVLGSSSGIHDRHDQYYVRRIRMNKDDALYKYLNGVIPALCEDDLFSPTGGVVSIPQESPETAIIRTSTAALQLLDRAMKFNKFWVAPGHRSGKNMHNVSTTISVREEEWGQVGEFMWKNRNNYTGISLLPFNGGTYQQAPFESCTKEKYEEMTDLVKAIDLRQVMELDDYTNRMEQLACVGGVCELQST
jgi:ribonucleoside-diphosphate reductase alpha chain